MKNFWKIGVAALALLATQPAMAQNKFRLSPATSTTEQTQREKLGCDPLNLKPGCKTAKVTDGIKKLSDAMSPEMKDFVTFVQGDVKSAIDLTSTFPALPDGNAQACFGQIKNSSDIIAKLQDIVDKGDTIGVVTVYEALRLLHMNLIKTCENKACTQIFNEVTNVVTSATPTAFKLGVPSITKLCASVPSIAMEPVTAAATSTPTPTPSPSPTPTATPSP